MGRGKEEVSVIIRRQPEKNNNDLSLTAEKNNIHSQRRFGYEKG